MTIIYGNVVSAFTQDLMIKDELKTGVRVARRDQKKVLTPQHVVDTYYLSHKLLDRHGQPTRRALGDGSVLLAERNSDIALYVGIYRKKNVGFGVSIETGGTDKREGAVYVNELYFPAARRNGWVYGYIDRGDDGKTLRVKSKSALGDAAQSLWKVRVTLWPIYKWEGNNQVHESDAPPLSVERSAGVGTGGLDTGETVGSRDTARHTRIIQSGRDKRNYQTFHIMTGSDEEVGAPIQLAP